MDEAFKVGDKVQWESQAGGFSKLKTGEIIQVVEPGQKPFKMITGECGSVRKRVSYVVLVYGSRGGIKTYWPLAWKLRKAVQ